MTFKLPKLDITLLALLGGFAVLVFAAYTVYQQHQQKTAVAAAANSLPIFGDCGD